MACRITTLRLILSPFGPEHISETYIGWLNDSALMTFSQNAGRVHDRASCVAYAKSFDHQTRWLWAIHTYDGAHIGNINAYLTMPHSAADIGILIGVGGGKGYGQEAWEGVMQALMSHLDIRKVTGGCMRPHIKMQQLMKRAGMKPDGEGTVRVLLGGKRVEVVRFAQFRSSFTPRGDIACVTCAAPDWSGETG